MFALRSASSTMMGSRQACPRSSASSQCRTVGAKPVSRSSTVMTSAVFKGQKVRRMRASFAFPPQKCPTQPAVVDVASVHCAVVDVASVHRYSRCWGCREQVTLGSWLKLSLALEFWARSHDAPLPAHCLLNDGAVSSQKGKDAPAPKKQSTVKLGLWVEHLVQAWNVFSLLSIISIVSSVTYHFLPPALPMQHQGQRVVRGEFSFTSWTLKSSKLHVTLRCSLWRQDARSAAHGYV